MTHTPRICVIGAGAVGTTVAARLALHGAAVSVVARNQRLGQIQRDGLRLQTPSGAEQHVCVRAGTVGDFGTQDYIFTAVKAYTLPGLLPTLAPLLDSATRVIPLVNGIPWWFPLGSHAPRRPVRSVDPTGELLSLLPSHAIIGCVVFVTAELERCGLVRSLGRERLIMGNIDAAHPSSIATITRLLSNAGLEANAATDIRAAIWTKVALNFATNPLSVVSRATLQEQFTNPALLRPLTDILQEVRRLAEADGHAPNMTTQQMLETGRAAGPFRTSMLQDFDAGRPLELDAIAYSCLELAEAHGVGMPVGRALADLTSYLARSRPSGDV